MAGAYIIIVMGVAVWAGLVPLGKQIPAAATRALTVFGGAFLLGICFLDMVPEAFASGDGASPLSSPLPCAAAVLAGFLLQQVLDSLSAHAEHGHTEHGFTLAGLMVGLCLHAFLEGMALTGASGTLNRGLLWGIVVHNIPIALILVGLSAARGFNFWHALALLLLFGIMSPAGSLFNRLALPPDPATQLLVTALVVGVLLHVSSSILFDHKDPHFSWLNTGLTLLAFVAAYFITQA